VAVSFVPPATPSGLPLSGYLVVTIPACPSCSGTLTKTTTASVGGLKVGTAYRFEVRAIDADGAGPASGASPSLVVRVASGYWLAASDGEVFGLGDSASLGSVSTTSVGTPRSAGRSKSSQSKLRARIHLTSMSSGYATRLSFLARS
jgi:hypothetical protein